MNAGDFDQFAALLVETAGRYNKTLSGADINTYFDNFTDHTLSAMRNAIALHAKDVQNGRFFPRIIDLQQQLTISRSGVNSDHREPPRCDYVAGREQCRYPVLNISSTMTIEEGTRYFCRFHRDCKDPRDGAEIVRQSEIVPYAKALIDWEAKQASSRARDLLTARGWVGDCSAEQAALVERVKKFIGSDKKRKWMLDVTLDFFAGRCGSRVPVDMVEEALGFKLKPDTVQQLLARDELARAAQQAEQLAAQERRRSDQTGA